MAEGDSIHRLAARLHRVGAGRTVVVCSLRTRRLALVDLTGRRLDAVVPYGKHLLMRLSPAAGATATATARDAGVALTLHSHLRMQGAWRVGTAGVRRRDDSVRAVLELDGGIALVGHRLPVLDLVATADEPRLLAHLGPDVLADAWDADTAAARLLRAPGRPVVAALLDQRTVAGIGNLYAVEGLWLARTWPWTRVGALEAPAALLDLVRDLMRRQLAAGHQNTTGRPGRGRRHWVYGRVRRPCHRCGTAIRRHDGGAGPLDRLTWWCPTCQPAPARC